MNSSDGSLEDGSSIVKRFLAFPSSFQAISTSSVRSKLESVSVVSALVALGDCEDRSKRSISRGLFRSLQAIRLLMKSGSDT